MKLLTIFRLYTIIIATIFSLSYAMEIPPQKKFIADVLTLTSTCINGDHLYDKIQDDLDILELQLLSGQTNHYTDELVNSDNKSLVNTLKGLEAKETPGYKAHLRQFRISVVNHHHLAQEELEKLKKSLNATQTPTARTENIAYAKELIGNTNPHVCVYKKHEKEALILLKHQRKMLTRFTQKGGKPSLEWLKNQEKILHQYLEIQEQYRAINPLLTDQEKNERYKKELEKTKIAIKKHYIKEEMKKAALCFRNSHSVESLVTYKKQVQELQNIDLSSEKTEIIALIDLVEKVQKYKNKDFTFTSTEYLERVITELLDYLTMRNSDNRSKVADTINSHLYQDILATLDKYIIQFCGEQKTSSDEISCHDLSTIGEQGKKIKNLYIGSDPTNKSFFERLFNRYEERFIYCIDIIIKDIQNDTGRFNKKMQLEEKLSIAENYFNQYPEILAKAQAIIKITNAINVINSMPTPALGSPVPAYCSPEMSNIIHFIKIIAENIHHATEIDIKKIQEIPQHNLLQAEYSRHWRTIFDELHAIEDVPTFYKACKKIEEYVPSFSSVSAILERHTQEQQKQEDRKFLEKYNPTQKTASQKAEEEKKHRDPQERKKTYEKAEEYHLQPETRKKDAQCKATKIELDMQAIECYRRVSLEQLSAQDVQKYIANLVQLHENAITDDTMRNQISDILKTYIEALEDKDIPQNPDVKQYTDRYDQYATVQALKIDELTQAYDKILLKYINRLLEMIQERRGAFNNISAAERLSSSRQYCPEMYASNDTFKRAYAGIANACADTWYEKCMNIITAPLRFAHYLSDMLWFMYG